MAVRIPYHRLRSGNRGIATGIGGARNYYSEPGVLVFEDDQFNSLQCNLEIFVADIGAPDSLQQIPSLLGRDFLNLCDVRLNYHTGLVSLEPANLSAYGKIARQ